MNTPEIVKSSRRPSEPTQTQPEVRSLPNFSQSENRNPPPQFQPQVIYQPVPVPTPQPPQVVHQEVPKFDSRLDSTLDRATYELEASRNRLINSGNYAAGQNFASYPPAFAAAPPPQMTHAPQPAPRLQLDNLERSFDGPQRSQRKVQISEKVTPRRDNDILNLSGSLGIGEKSARDRQKENYGRELQEQMRIREEKKRLQKKKDEEYDLRYFESLINY